MHSGQAPGLVSYTTPLNVFNNRPTLGLNPTYGRNMNVNGSVSGTPDSIYLENVEWSTGAISGTWDFASTVQAQQGTLSVDATGTTNNDTALFSRASTVDLNAYASLTLQIYVTDWDSRGTKDINLQFRLAGVTVGDVVPLTDYNSFTDTNQWLAITIPLTAFGAAAVSTVDELTVTTIDIGAGPPPDYYLDAIQLQQTGEPIIFKIEPPKGEIRYITALEWVIADNVAATVTNGTMPGLSYDKFGGLTSLSNGVLFRRIRREEIITAFVVKDFGDFAGLPGTVFAGGFSDGVNSVVKLATQFTTPVELNSDYGDRIEAVISDDLSGLLRFNWSASGYIPIDPDVF